MSGIHGGIEGNIHDAEKTIMIGNDIVGDVKGAQTAGMRIALEKFTSGLLHTLH